MERTEIVICRCPAGVGDEVEAEAEMGETVALSGHAY